jgi:hypothetical protein
MKSAAVRGGGRRKSNAGLRVYGDNCGTPALENTIGNDQLWYVCPRSGGSISLEPAVGVTWYSKSVWLDVWGGNSENGKSAAVRGRTSAGTPVWVTRPKCEPRLSLSGDAFRGGQVRRQELAGSV